MTTQTTATLREMRWWDIHPVLALERELFPDDAWSRGMFWSELAHARGPGASRRYVVAEDGGRLVGYAGLAAAGDLADVQTIAVARDQWGSGLGGRLLADLLRHATAFACTSVMLEVRVDNTRAQRLYERFGFAPLGLRPGYYQPGNVDALVMRLADPALAAAAYPLPAAGASAHVPDAVAPAAGDPAGAPGVPGATGAPDAPDAPDQGTETHG